MAQSYENLNVWQESVALAVVVYTLTKSFPKDELFGITSQLRRAVVSVSANIAEGAGRNSKGDYCRFLDIATGSLHEVESILAVAYSLEYISREKLSETKERTSAIGKMLGALKNYLRKK